MTKKASERNRRTRFAGCLPVVLLVVTAGCSNEGWESAETLRASDAAVGRALSDFGHGSADVSAKSVPVIEPPGALRPCCAFGVDLQIKVGSIPLPGIEIGNVTGKTELGPHRFNNGFISLNRHDTRGWIDDEVNGLVYTCRGGFVDIAHVRDNADITLACASGIARLMDAGGSFALPSQGAKITARLKPMDPQLLERYGRREITIPFAQWLDFQISIWHEIATWYGYASLAEWPEKISAFSPEDLYSNLIGGKIAGGILEEHGASSDETYDRNMDAWIRQVLRRLGDVPVKQGQAAMRSVDGLWWNSHTRIPDWQLVLRRNFNTGPDVTPWLVADATPPPPPDRRFTGCGSAHDPLILRHADGFEGIAFRDYATLEFDVGDGLATNGFAFPRAGSRVVTQEDFPFIIAAIRRANAAAFGVPADAP